MGTGPVMDEINRTTLCRDDSAIYPMVGDEVNYLTGLAADRDQILAIVAPRSLIMRFNPNGTLKDAREITEEIEGPATEPQTDEKILLEWLKEQVGFRPGPIAVRRFN